jgi:GT2 family glycosyltransferase
MSVGGVGGRCVNMDGTQEVKYPIAKKVGRFLWFGRVIGNMYRETVFMTPIKVDFFMGGNMSYRRSLLELINIDLKLNNYVAANYEVDLGLQIKELGYTLVYDQMARIKHFSAPRSKEVLRVRSSEAIYWYSFNLQYITLKHSKGWRRLVGSIYGITVGDQGSWGIAAALIYTLKRRRFNWVKEIKPAFAGKLHAIRRYINGTATT